MNIYAKLMALFIIVCAHSPAEGMQRLLKTTKHARARLASAPTPRLMHARTIATGAQKNAQRTATVPTVKAQAPQARALFFSHALRKFFPGKQNDPEQFEVDVRAMIEKNAMENLDAILNNNAELLKKNNNQFVRKPSAVPYLIQAAGQARETQKDLMAALIKHCPTEVNEVYFNPKVQASGGRRLEYAHHEYPTPLSVAVQHHHYDTADMLLDNNADANTILGHPDYPTVLAHAVKRCEPKLVQKLLERGAHIRYAGYDALATARRNFHHFGTSYEADIVNLLEQFNNKNK